MDAMWYEAYYFYSADYLNSGTGLSLISSYLTFPFLPTLITRQVTNHNLKYSEDSAETTVLE